MSVLSYAFGSTVIFANDDSSKLSRRKIGGQRNFGFNFNINENTNYEIIRELKNYEQGYQESVVKFLSDIPGSQNLNTRMLVAAYQWFFRNNSPEVFTPDMFTTDNIAFNLIMEKSYKEKFSKGEWRQEHNMSLEMYAKLIRENQSRADIKDRPRPEIDHIDSESDSDYYEDTEVDNDSNYASDYD